MTLSTSTVKEQCNFLSMFDLESRHRAFSKGNFTTHPLHSPVPHTVTAGQFGYLTDGDLHMLLQVLKQVPGSARPVDNTVASLTCSGPGCGFSKGSPPGPSAFGNPCLATPYLPATHYSISNMPSAASPMQQHLHTLPIIGIYQTARPEKHSSNGSNGSNQACAAGDMDYVVPFEVLKMYSIKHDVLDWVN
ncbi:hypothetical protein GGI06_004715, partial [Coemansia sp. S85]